MELFTGFVIIGLLLLIGMLLLLHSNLMKEYQRIAQFSNFPELETVVKIVHGIFIYFYIIIICALFLITRGNIT